MELVEVNSKRLLHEFILSPWQVYRDDKVWVPPLISDRYFVLTNQNPFWQHAEKKLWLLKLQNKYVGRIAGIIDKNYLEFQQEKTGFFGFYESINDQSISNLLLSKVCEWIKSQGMQRVYGPISPSTNDELGLLYDGFGVPAKLMMAYNPDYYLNQMETYGLTKVKDVYAYIMDVAQAPQERLAKVYAKVTRREKGLTIRPINLNDFTAEVDRAIEIYNHAWDKNWGFVPWTREEFTAIAKQMKPLFVPDPTAIAEVDGRPVGILLAVPDYNEVFRRLNGRLGLVEIIKLMYYKNRIKGLRLMIMGVVKEYRNRGIEAAMYYRAWQGAMRRGYKECEFSWVLEDNLLTQRAAEFMGGKIYKKYRVYGTSL